MKFTSLLAGVAMLAAAAEAKSAEASHILVKDEAKCNELKASINSPEEFSACAPRAALLLPLRACCCCYCHGRCRLLCGRRARLRQRRADGGAASRAFSADAPPPPTTPPPGAAAKEHSTCPSGKSGGSLGEFGPGQMVPEFDAVIWTADLDKVTDCVKTQFGYHLIIVTKRSE
jgi:anaerobic selenocysteine-containing dehydrogenase